MSLLERDSVLVSTTKNGDPIVDLPFTRVNNVEGIGRSPNTAYAVGNVVYTDSNLSVALKCTQAGTTSNTELDISTKAVGDTITDGSVVWVVMARDALNALPLSGGVLSSAESNIGIRANDQDLWIHHTENNVANRTVVGGGVNATDGAMLYLNGGGRDSAPGAFEIRAQSKTGNTRGLIGFPDGSLTWRGTALTIKAGDIITLSNGAFVGYITSNTKNLYVHIPFVKPIIAESVTVNSFVATIRQNGAYVVSVTDIKQYLAAATINETGIVLVFQNDSAWNGTNNTECAVQITGATFTFN